MSLVAIIISFVSLLISIYFGVQNNIINSRLCNIEESRSYIVSGKVVIQEIHYVHNNVSRYLNINFKNESSSYNMIKNIKIIYSYIPNNTEEENKLITRRTIPNIDGYSLNNESIDNIKAYTNTSRYSINYFSYGGEPLNYTLYFEDDIIFYSKYKVIDFNRQNSLNMTGVDSNYVEDSLLDFTVKAAGVGNIKILFDNSERLLVNLYIYIEIETYSNRFSMDSIIICRDPLSEKTQGKTEKIIIPNHDINLKIKNNDL